jgi:hypothetical protein
MTEALLSMLVVASLAAGYGLLHIGTDEAKGCGHCDGDCTYDPECAESRVESRSLPRQATSDILRIG